MEKMAAIRSLRAKSSSKMAATITSFPHEIIVEILSWLPIEYLSPLRYVSKTWLKLLTTDPHFVSEYVSGSLTHTHVSVYTLGIDSSWRTLEEHMAWILPNECSLVNGVLHWLASKPGSDYRFDGILTLDLKKEYFQGMPLPNDFNFDVTIFYSGITELGGLLCIYFKIQDQGLQIWAMKEYGVVSSWTKQFTIVISSCFSCLRPLGVVTHDREYVVVKGMEELILYDSKSNSSNKLEDFGFRLRDAYSYIGSIISPRVISGAHKT